MIKPIVCLTVFGRKLPTWKLFLGSFIISAVPITQEFIYYQFFAPKTILFEFSTLRKSFELSEVVMPKNILVDIAINFLAPWLLVIFIFLASQSLSTTNVALIRVLECVMFSLLVYIEIPYFKIIFYETGIPLLMAYYINTILINVSNLKKSIKAKYILILVFCTWAIYNIMVTYSKFEEKNPYLLQYARLNNININEHLNLFKKYSVPLENLFVNDDKNFSAAADGLLGRKAIIVGKGLLCGDFEQFTSVFLHELGHYRENHSQILFFLMVFILCCIIFIHKNIKLNNLTDGYENENLDEISKNLEFLKNSTKHFTVFRYTSCSKLVILILCLRSLFLFYGYIIKIIGQYLEIKADNFLFHTEPALVEKFCDYLLTFVSETSIKRPDFSQFNLLYSKLSLLRTHPSPYHRIKRLLKLIRKINIA